MSVWNYTNIGVSPKPEDKSQVEKIFEYIGHTSNSGFAPDGDSFCPHLGDIYRGYDLADVKSCFLEHDYDEKQLLYILNALFPQTTVY